MSFQLITSLVFLECSMLHDAFDPSIIFNRAMQLAPWYGSLGLHVTKFGNAKARRAKIMPDDVNLVVLDMPIHPNEKAFSVPLPRVTSSAISPKG